MQKSLTILVAKGLKAKSGMADPLIQQALFIEGMGEITVRRFVVCYLFFVLVYKQLTTNNQQPTTNNEAKLMEN
ncbi:MAG: hypothetical protein F6K41_00360 [Symploca sp. SIO3E6]|nr:hypothetical protein [Caldora sp. SIO3E6]